jgi:hypothetical protein
LIAEAELARAAGLDPEAYRWAEAGEPSALTYLDLIALADPSPSRR